MYNKIKVTGMVIAAMPVGEYDRRITILTNERGKISAFARGARKPTGALLACSQQFAFGEFFLYEGRDSYNLESADIKTYFGDIRNDMNGIYYGMYMCEFALYMSRENVQPGQILNLLYVTMRALEKAQMPKKLIRRTFELRYLTEDGEMPDVYSCMVCGRDDLLEDDMVRFDAEKGGIVCNACNIKNIGLPVSHSALYALQYIVSAPLERLFSFNVTENVLEELDRIVAAWVASRVGHKMKAEEMLDMF
jgi:DNA repair protein RecO (recombination protein O)